MLVACSVSNDQFEVIIETLTRTIALNTEPRLELMYY